MRDSAGKYAKERPAWFCTCGIPQPDGLYQCTTCFRLVYRDDY